MSFRERRERDERRARERAVVGMRDLVIAAQSGFLGSLGSAAITDAVDEALAGMKPAERVGDPEQVRGVWIHRATCRLIDQQRSAEVLHREPVALDEHAQALTVSVSGELGELGEDARQCWRVEEIVESVQDEDQAWGHAFAERVLDGSLEPGAQPRGLPQQLGWTTEQTKLASRRARRAMAAFIQQRASGEVCRKRQALLDSFIATDTAAGEGRRPVLDQERYLAMIFHLGACQECSLAWRARRATLAHRVAPLLALPLDAVSWVARVARDLASSVDIATLSVRQRLGASAATIGGGAATVGTKTTAVCAAAVCAAGAGAGGELAGVLPPIVPQRAQHEPRKHTPRHDPRPARQTVRPASAVTPAPASPAPAPAPAPAQASSVPDRPVAPEEHFTLGDLPPASSTSRGRSSHDSPRGRSSAPGDLPPASSTSSGGSSKDSSGGGLSAPGDLPSASATPPPPPPPAGADGAHCVLGDLEC